MNLKKIFLKEEYTKKQLKEINEFKFIVYVWGVSTILYLYILIGIIEKIILK